ncbi:AAA family ATPase [Devosia rhodophyticola]|uniref:AAA family ATPase n=1 Tax=Devosia rhodophyticola TaxID=3026423 RepID=A0ABY7YWP2_9HYPH|nr:AAA family ATPase [Devosia rhodophyticola]WDR05810.1 AAA family ATPase [Devosia rhodophyticola]
MSDPDALEGLLVPEQQSSIFGHRAAISAVDQQLADGRLPGALLLHGPRGVGKATLAFQLSRRILAATGDEDAHRVDEQITAGGHPNIRVLRRAPKDSKSFYTVIRVDEIRNLRSKLQQTRGRAGARIAIIDPIDDCNPSAANALLKTLEEPPPDTVFFLISHRPGQLLPTIKSRCQSVALRPLNDADMSGALLAQRTDLAKDDLALAIELGGGRPRRGFETLTLSSDSMLGALRSWLTAPSEAQTLAHLKLSEALAGTNQRTELSFAREMIIDWIASEARTAATMSTGRMRLASANELWDKAHAHFAEADSINLDMKQTLITIFDAIRKHARSTAPAPFE